MLKCVQFLEELAKSKQELIMPEDHCELSALRN